LALVINQKAERGGGGDGGEPVVFQSTPCQQNTYIQQRGASNQTHV